jgi:Leucine-rich repeat (LRR) protein
MMLFTPVHDTDDDTDDDTRGLVTVDDDGRQGCRRCLPRHCSLIMSLTLCLSLTTLVIGCGLLALSVLRVGGGTTTTSDNDWSVAEMRNYWLFLNEALRDTATMPLIPASPAYKALQWMVAHDPLRPLDDNAEHLHQRYAMCYLYYVWAGAGWALPDASGWPRDYTGSNHNNNNKLAHECTWLGVTCNENQQVTGLLFDSEVFSLGGGTIPAELGSLTALRSLELSGHEIQGRLPAALGQLTALTRLDISFNRLTGLDTVAVWPNLEVLLLNNNDLRGDLDLGAVAGTRLRVLALGLNELLEGDLVSLLTAWPQLETVDLIKTKVSGSIPVEIGRLTDLKKLSVQAHLMGSIPPAIGNCTALEFLQVIGSQEETTLTGEIPTQLGQLERLFFLDLKTNPGMRTTIPTEFGRLTNLEILDFAGSGLYGHLPTELGLLTVLERFEVGDNDLSGTIPVEFGNLVRLGELGLPDNRFTGSMPQEVCDLGPIIFADCKLPIYPFQCECCSCV